MRAICTESAGESPIASRRIPEKPSIASDWLPGKQPVRRTHLLPEVDRADSAAELPVDSAEGLPVVHLEAARAAAVAWETRREPAGKTTPRPVLADGRIYYVTRAGLMYVLAAQPEFKLLAKNEFPGDDSGFSATPAIGGNDLFVRSNKYLYCLSSD